MSQKIKPEKTDLLVPLWICGKLHAHRTSSFGPNHISLQAGCMGNLTHFIYLFFYFLFFESPLNLLCFIFPYPERINGPFAPSMDFFYFFFGGGAFLGPNWPGKNPKYFFRALWDLKYFLHIFIFIFGTFLRPREFAENHVHAGHLPAVQTTWVCGKTAWEN